MPLHKIRKPTKWRPGPQALIRRTPKFVRGRVSFSTLRFAHVFNLSVSFSLSLSLSQHILSRAIPFGSPPAPLPLPPPPFPVSVSYLPSELALEKFSKFVLVAVFILLQHIRASTQARVNFCMPFKIRYTSPPSTLHFPQCQR